MRLRAEGRRWLVATGPLLASLCLAAGASARQSEQLLRTVTYHGYSVTVPRSWPVYNLARQPHTCVRFNRHAVYLGIPGGAQSCPARAAGRTEAILIEPVRPEAAGARTARAGSGPSALAPIGGSATTFLVSSANVAVTATWLHDPRLIAAALHRSSVHPSATVATASLAPEARVARAPLRAAADIYTGPGFDACYAPSQKAMTAWTAHSPYHAIGIYIGGANAACPPSRDPNLTSTWLNDQAAAGWHYIPTYVGLQAPSNSCGCASMSTNTSQAAAQGTAAAQDAVTQAQALGFPAGTPIYNDMEYYSRTTTNTGAVLAFLSAWTAQLHSEGYLSGVYGNADSAIADLADQYGTSYTEPDDIWFAAWPGDGTQSTTDPNIPSADWASHQRLHQYSGAHNETYGGYAINIDGDYLDGATAGSVVNGPPPPPSLALSPTATGTDLTASWSGLGLTGWSILAGTSPGSLVQIATAGLQGGKTTIAVRSVAPYFAVQALGSGNQVLATSAAQAAPGRLMIFGGSSFVGQLSHVGGIPVGCYLTNGCHLTATLSAGRAVVATTPVQAFRPGGSGLLFYRLTPRGRVLIAAARSLRLPVRVTVKDASGTFTTASLRLIPFSTSGPGPARELIPSPVVSVAGSTDYVWGGWSGGILVRCGAVYACAGATGTLNSGHTVIGSLDYGVIGGGELGYLFYSVTPAGHQLLIRAPGNQLRATLALHLGNSVARAWLVLAQFR